MQSVPFRRRSGRYTTMWAWHLWVSIVEFGRLGINTVVLLVLLLKDHVAFVAPRAWLTWKVAVIMFDIVTDVVSVSAVSGDRLEWPVLLTIPHVLIQFVPALIPRWWETIHAWLLYRLLAVLILVSLSISAVAITASRSRRSSWIFTLLSTEFLDRIDVLVVNNFVGCWPQVVTALVDAR